MRNRKLNNLFRNCMLFVSFMGILYSIMYLLSFNSTDRENLVICSSGIFIFQSMSILLILWKEYLWNFNLREYVNSFIRQKQLYQELSLIYKNKPKSVKMIDSLEAKETNEVKAELLEDIINQLREIL